MPDACAHSAPVQTRILIIDDHTTFAELLAGALDREPDMACVGFAGSVAEGVDKCRDLSPDAVIMDYQLGDGTGLMAAARILDFAAHTRIIMLTGHPTPAAMGQAAALGICAFLPKDGSLATLLEMLRHARVGSMAVPPALFAVREHPSIGFGIAPLNLTQREREILHLMVMGNGVPANARALGISEHTCRGYVKSILAKLGVHSQLEAVAVATRRGLLCSDAPAP